MPDKWPSLYEQINAVLAAPIPFFLAVIVVAVIVWRGGEWLYRSVLNKRKELYELSRNEVEHWKQEAERTTKELTGQIELLKTEQENTVLTKTALDKLMATTSQLAGQLDQLSKANTSPMSVTAVSRALLTSGHSGPPAMDWTSTGWKTRNPTDVTGPSG
jgi:hypothetical protein